MRNRFDQQLEALNQALIEMGGLIEDAIENAVEALLKKDAGLARKAIALDASVDDKERAIERLCLQLLLQQQPVARDLRTISAALKMITDLERLGDQAADISEITLHLREEPYILNLHRIPQMGKTAIGMVRDSIDAFISRDMDLAHEVIARDDQVDQLFLEVRQDLIDLIREDPAHGSQAMDLLMVAKYMERIGDHATNVAEWVLFAITGVHKTVGDGPQL